MSHSTELRRRSQAGLEAVSAGDKCVLMKERGVMVVGLSLQEWRVLLEKNTGSDKMQMISGVEEAVMRGLSQSEGTADLKLKARWNAWALALCKMEGGCDHLRSKCLLQRSVLQLQQQQHQQALESATEVLELYPDSRHASALVATALHKSGKKKEAASAASDLVLAIQKAEVANALSDELGCTPTPTLPPPRLHAVSMRCSRLSWPHAPLAATLWTSRWRC